MDEQSGESEEEEVMDEGIGEPARRGQRTNYRYELSLDFDRTRVLRRMLSEASASSRFVESRESSTIFI